MTDMSTPTVDRAVLLGRRIRRLRGQKGYTSIEAFARDLGFSWITVSRYERGKSTPNHERLYRIADLLDVDLSELLDGLEDEPEVA